MEFWSWIDCLVNAYKFVALIIFVWLIYNIYYKKKYKKFNVFRKIWKTLCTSLLF